MRRELAWISGPLLRRLRQLSTSSIYLSTNCSLRGAAQCHNASVEGVQPGLESPTVDGKVFTRNKDLPDRWKQQTQKRSVNVGKRAATTETCTVSKEEETHHIGPPDSDSSDSMTDHRGMQLVFLGTSSSVPTITRNTSCIALRLTGTIYMFDCGEGVQQQLQRSGFRQTSIDNIFITHMHGDHIFGLPGLLCNIGMSAPPTKQPVHIFGPAGLRDWIRMTMKSCYARVFPKFVVHELSLHQAKSSKRIPVRNTAADKHEDELPGKDILASKDGLWHVHEDDRYTVKAGLLAHPVPCWGYVIEEHPRPGRFSVNRALAAGVKPGPLFGRLQKGHPVTLSNGKVVQATDVLGHTRRGRKVGADVLVHEATLIEKDAFEADKRGHSTASMAGEFAKAVNAKKLVLTHFSGKLEGALCGFNERGAGTVQDLVNAAKAAFGKDVVAARDLLALTVFSTDEPSEMGP